MAYSSKHSLVPETVLLWDRTQAWEQEEGGTQPRVTLLNKQQGLEPPAQSLAYPCYSFLPLFSSLTLSS